MPSIRLQIIAITLQAAVLSLGVATLPEIPHAAESTAPDVLAALAETFLRTENVDEAASLLERIATHPEATIASVTQAIRIAYTYKPQPVGAQPDESINVRDRLFHYALFVPPSYDSSKAYPLVVCLHGAGFTGDAYLDRWIPRLGEAYILVCPTYPQGAWFTRRAEELVLEVVRAIERRYHIDRNRVFLTGMSNGGIGAWLIGMHHASTFAGIAPMAGGLDDVLFPFLENLRATPAYIIHGSRDQVMPVELSRSVSRELARLGIKHVYREHDRSHPMAGGHFFPREELPDVVKWLNAQQRQPFPKTITVVRDASHLLPFGWVRIDGTDEIAAFSEDLIDRSDEAIKQRRYAKLTATVSDGQRIEVKTERVRHYTLLLSPELIDLARPITVITDGRLSFQGLIVPDLRMLLRQARRDQDPERLIVAQIPITVEKDHDAAP
jgi:pimeloyl-ACP methyl ester carboxylesterase